MQHNLRPFRDLIAYLPRLPVDESWNVDFKVADPAPLATMAANAEATMAAIQSGLGAIGHLLVHSAVVIEDGTIGADSPESLGFLMAELGDLAAACMMFVGAAGGLTRSAYCGKLSIESVEISAS